MSVVVGLALDEDRSCAEREAAWMGMFALSVRSGVHGLVSSLPFLEMGYEPTIGGLYDGRLDGTEGVAVGAAFLFAQVAGQDCVGKFDVHSAQLQLERQKYTSKVAILMQFPKQRGHKVDRWKQLMPVVIECTRNDNLALASGACSLMTMLLMASSLFAEFVCESFEAPRVCLDLLHRVALPCASASWWKERSTAGPWGPGWIRMTRTFTQ